MKSHALYFALLSAIASAPAQAQNGSLTRSFVSSAGLNTNACTIAAPCATFAQAYTAIGANGIIAALDPGKYGPITITGPVTINGNGWSAITATAQGNGITINAGSGNVSLTGLEIDGAGAGYNGIVFNSGGNLVVKNCVLKDFVLGTGQSGNGIWIAPVTGTITFTIVDTIVTNSANAGIWYFPPSGSATATGVIDHVVVTGSTSSDGAGIGASMTDASGGSAAINISNSVISNNTGTTGVFAYAPSDSIVMTLDNDEISYNTTGVGIIEGTIVLGRSTITNNSAYGIYNNGTIDTFQNNQVYANGNSNAVFNNALTPVTPQ